MKKETSRILLIALSLLLVCFLSASLLAFPAPPLAPEKPNIQDDSGSGEPVDGSIVGNGGAGDNENPSFFQAHLKEIILAIIIILVIVGVSIFAYKFFTRDSEDKVKKFDEDNIINKQNKDNQKTLQTTQKPATTSSIQAQKPAQTSNTIQKK